MPSRTDDPVIADLSEGQVLRAILARTPQAHDALVGPGDDAAVVSAASGSVVATTDTLVHGPDFRLAWTDGFSLGWKAAAVNLADIAAMGARPTALLVALAVPDDTRLSYITDIADGLREACAALAPGCAVVGGDLTVSDVLTVAVTALGDMQGRAPVLRSGARVGDQVVLGGLMGRSARGLEILFDRFRDDGGRPIPVDAAALDARDLDDIAAQLRPSPPIRLGPIAAAAGATAMMDVSDGLRLDAGRMADASDVTLDLRSAALGDDPQAALAGGEDHALLAAFPQDAAVPDGFIRIGAVIERAEHGVLCDGNPVADSGWDPYRDWDAATG